jgi:hypothetical protein
MEYNMRLKEFSITFETGTQARAIKVSQDTTAQEIVSSLALDEIRGLMIIAGGASGMTPEEQVLSSPLFVDGLAPFASKEHVAVFDGGSDTGVMKLTGYGRAQVLAYKMQDFPLIGVDPAALVRWPGHRPVGALVDLEPNHSHFVLIPGDRFGPEDEIILDLAAYLDRRVPSLTVIVNGGSITLDDALLNALVGRPMIVIKGSGRAADQIANAMNGSRADSRITEIVQRGRITLFDIHAGAEAFCACLRQVLFGAYRAK